jgi:4-hydroxybenzoate polyprenyltransferase
VSWFRLIRWTNLLIIFLAQLLAWFCVLKPLEKLTGSVLFLNKQNFFLLSFSTILIAAAGYIINDYFDVRIDNINRPEKMVLEKIIPRKHAIIVHSVLNVVAIAIALFLAQKAGHISFALLQIFCMALLWFYSTKFKQRFAIGNFVVAILTSLTIVILFVYEPALYPYCRKPVFITFQNQTVLPNPVWVLAVYAFFAFVLTWMREAVKDMEDFKGDEAEGCVTMPIVWGLQRTVQFIMTFAVFATLPLLLAANKLLLNNNYFLGIYVWIAIIIPISLFMYLLPKKTTAAHYAFASRLLKLIMVTGVCSLLIYYYEAHG